MQQFTLNLFRAEEEADGVGPGQMGYDPMKDPSKMNVNYN